MKVSIHKRKRIVLLFTLGIVLPSLLLGYLAFRGIQNDRALLEKEKLNEHRRIAEQSASLIEENILSVEQAFSATIADHQEMPSPMLTLSLENFKSKNPLVDQIFYIQDFSKIRFPIAKLLYVPDGSQSPPPLLSRPLHPSRNERYAQQSEFQQKNYQKALVTYQQAMAQTTDALVKGELLNAVARVQKKSALLDDAIETYKRIAIDFNHVCISDGLPLGLVARLELASLFWTLSNLSGSIETFMHLYQALLDQEWTLEKAQYEFFKERVQDSIEEIFSKSSSDPKIESFIRDFSRLEEEEKKKREITDRVLAFQEGAASDIMAKTSGELSNTRGSTVRFSLEIGKYTYLVSMLMEAAQNQERSRRAWGLLINADYLRENILLLALRRHASSGETAWIIKGRDGRVLLVSEEWPSGTVTVRANFASSFPDWSMEFSQLPPRLLKTFLTSRQGLYLYIFLLIAGIFIFSLILTIRTVAHELELAKMKSDLVSTISHEFKSPLTSIRQLAEMLHSGRVPSEERRQQYYDVLLEQSERLSLLTDNILNLAKIEEGRKEFAFQRTDPSALLEEIVTSVQDRVRHEGFVITLEIKKPLPLITIDRAAITQALANLIDNAIKYSGESKMVIVSSSTEAAFLTIAVRDFGIGIKKEDRDRVFERFYRGGDELTRTVKGSGLGLTLVKEIVEAHHGKVHLESEPGQGSTFSIRLPLQEKQSE